MKSSFIIAGLFAAAASASAVIEARHNGWHAKHTNTEVDCWKRCFHEGCKATSCPPGDYRCECQHRNFLYHMKTCEAKCGCEMREYVAMFCPRNGPMKSFGHGRYD